MDLVRWKIVNNTSSATLFLPAAGYMTTTLQHNNIYGYGGDYWSSSLSTTNEPSDAVALSFDNNGLSGSQNYQRKNGLSVRPISE